METTTSFSKHIAAKKKIVVSQGGSNSAKSYTIMSIFVLIAEAKKDKILSVVMADIPTLKRGVIRDFKTIMGDNFQERNWNATDRVYTFPGGSIIEFFGADDANKLKVGKRDYCWIDEANNLTNGFASFQQLNIRTSTRFYISYNPSNRFWVHDKVIPSSNCDYVHTTYKDNEYCNTEIAKELEDLKYTNPLWYQVYTLGQTGAMEGTVYQHGKHYHITDKFPENYDRKVWGIDMGYTNSYTALVECRMVGNDIYVKEHKYALKMETPDYIKLFKERIPKGDLIISDVDNRFAADMKKEGFNLQETKKGKGSVLLGIEKVKEYVLYITSDSHNFIKEMQGYTWLKDKQGEALNQPILDPIHCGDAVRYVIFSVLSINRRKPKFR